MPMLHPRSRGCAEEATFEHAVSKPAEDRGGSRAREEVSLALGREMEENRITL